MTPKVIRLEEAMGLEGLGQMEGLSQMEGIGQMEGLSQMEGIGQMEGTGQTEAPRRTVSPKPAAPAPAQKRNLRSAMPGMRTAVVWAEILGKPRALKGRR